LASKAKPYERFGSYLLFKKLENDSLSELWRAAEIEGEKLGGVVALRRFTGGNRAALKTAASDAAAVAGALSGTTVVRGQKVDFVGDIPFLVHEYSGGRTLKTVMERGRGTAASPANPIPVDQALAIVEKLATSCEMLANVRYQGARLVHGALVPQFVWISEEGEVRAAGQQFGKGVIASLTNREVAAEYASYFAPEYRASGEATKSSDVYSLGALLFLMLTGKEVPQLSDAEALRQTIESARLANREEAIPADIRPLLQKTLSSDVAERYPSATELRQTLDKMINGGAYSPTTFNLAFYLHSLLKKDMESEATERPREESVDLAPYLAPEPVVVAAAPAVAAVAPSREPAVATPFSSFAAEEEKPRKGKGALIGVAAALVAVAAGAWVVFSPKAKPAPAPKTQTAQVAPATTTAPATIEPIVAAAPSTGTAAPLPVDEAARQKMIEEAVKQRLQAEMMKLQEDYNKQLQSQQVMQPSRPAAAAAVPPPAAVTRREETSVSAAQLDQQRRAQSLPANPEPSAPATQTSAPAVVENTPQPVVAQPQVAAIREGDVVAVNELDSIPELRSPVRPVYPPMAAKRKLEATIIVSALINENGRVTDIKILRGDTARIGFEDAATRAVRAAVFTSPMKGGKRVKTWKPMPVIFKLQ
jgi:TonB family protein